MPVETYSQTIESQAQKYVLNISRDISERKKTRRELHSHRNYLEKLNNSLSEVVLTISEPDKTIEYVNKAIKHVLGYKPEECTGIRDIKYLFSDEKEYDSFMHQVDIAISERKETLKTEHMLKRKNSERFPAEITTSFLIEDDHISGSINVIRDITEYKQSQIQLAHMTTHDWLTGLPNRTLFHDRLTIALAGSDRHRQK